MAPGPPDLVRPHLDALAEDPPIDELEVAIDLSTPERAPGLGDEHAIRDVETLFALPLLPLYSPTFPLTSPAPVPDCRM